MKNIFILSLCAMVLTGIIGCKKDDSTTNPGGGSIGSGSARITLNGGGLTNKTLNFSGVAGAYSVDENGTAGVGFTKDGSDSISIIIGFPGQSARTATWVEDTTTVILTYINSGTSVAGFSGSTTVTSYGSVGGQIIGTFSGSALKTVISPLSIDTLSVSGSFSILRLSNQ